MQRAPSLAASPQVSICSPDVSDWGLPHPPNDPSESPTLTLLVCADIDVDSSSALVDYTLQQRDFDASLIDLIVAVGPFVKEGDLDRYMTPRIRRQRKERKKPLQGNMPDYMLPLLRSYEESCSMEGLVTSSLSQLENIVCRVVYCPGLSDPNTILRDPSKRLTSNSRNIHKQSLPIVPGLAVAGLMYLDGVKEIVRELELNAPSPNDRLFIHKDDEASATENSDQSNSLDTLERLVEQLQTHIHAYVPQLALLTTHASYVYYSVMTMRQR